MFCLNKVSQVDIWRALLINVKLARAGFLFKCKTFCKEFLQPKYFRWENRTTELGSPGKWTTDSISVRSRVVTLSQIAHVNLHSYGSVVVTVIVCGVEGLKGDSFFEVQNNRV